MRFTHCQFATVMNGSIVTFCRDVSIFNICCRDDAIIIIYPRDCYIITIRDCSIIVIC